jgi:O-antigen/teichoic acid export membrane protein
VTRIIRLVAIIVIARFTSPLILGTSALALSLFELVRVLANAGIGQRIIVATNEELDAVCNTALRLFWSCCAAVATIQLLVAAVLGLVFGQIDAATMLAVLALVYVIMPPGLVQVFLLMREGKLATTARISASQTILDHVLTMALVVIWPSAWAIVLPKLLTAPVWTIMVRNARHWSSDTSAGFAPISNFRGYAAGILSSEIMSALRAQADKLLVGALFGTKLLGIYYFAFNAGLGIAQSLVSAFGIVLFPYLARIKSSAAQILEARRISGFGLFFFAPLIIAQAAFAPTYVPVLFGETWAASANYVSILALGGLPLFAAASLSALYRAAQTTGREAQIGAAATIAALIGLVVGAQFSLEAACGGYVIGLALTFIPKAIADLATEATHSPPPERIAS